MDEELSMDDRIRLLEAAVSIVVAVVEEKPLLATSGMRKPDEETDAEELLSRTYRHMVKLLSEDANSGSRIGHPYRL